jgi:hypothetical protein
MQQKMWGEKYGLPSVLQEIEKRREPVISFIFEIFYSCNEVVVAH